MKNTNDTRELTVNICTSSEEAEKKYGKEKIKAYKASFSNMYHALTHRKTSTMMKLVCLLPEEKVREMLTGKEKERWFLCSVN